MSENINITWRTAPDGSIGWCNLCKSPIYNTDDPCVTGLHSPEHASHNCSKLSCWPARADGYKYGSAWKSETVPPEVLADGVAFNQ